MHQEIERKFLVKPDGLPRQNGCLFRQGYLTRDPARTVRVRLEGDKGVLTIKGKSSGISRIEFEYSIPRTDADHLLNICLEHPIEKTRYKIEHAGKTWEVDEFHGANAGLFLAEIELGSEHETFAKPGWLGKEVSTDKRYFNAYLSEHPYSAWPPHDKA